MTHLLAKHELRLYRFAGSVSESIDVRTLHDLPRVRDRLQSEKPIGQETHIDGALEVIFKECLDVHLAAIVLLTDGQPTNQPDWSKVTDLARTRGTPIFVVLIGSSEPPRDLAVREARAEQQVYLGDVVAVHCGVRETGLPPGTPFTVQLRDALTDEVHARQTLQAGGGETEHAVELQFVARATGLQKLIVEVPPLPEEMETDNNAQQIQINVVDQQIKVLYVDGYPRYEYRYLKNTLLRETSIVSSMLLLSADREFPQEGDEPIRRLPRDAEELSDFDVILFGDVDPREGWISDTQMELIVEFVNHGGGGFGLIAGEHYTPARFAGTPLERLIPVEVRSAAARSTTIAGAPFIPRLTAAGRDSALLRLVLDREQADQVLQELPPWYWYYAPCEPRPGSEVILEHPDSDPQHDPLPLVVVGRSGAGRTFYQGSDDTWRWRRHRGEGFFDTYWTQVIRYLARNKKFRTGSGITLRTDQRKVDRHRPVVVSLEFEEASQCAALPDTVQADLRNAVGVRLGEVSLTRLTANSRYFQGSYLPATTGQQEITFDPERYLLDDPPISTLIDVEPQTLENREPQANLALMTELADATGGAVVEPTQLASLLERIPDKQVVIPDDVTESIWDSRLALMIFVLLITTEWIMRKRSGLT